MFKRIDHIEIVPSNTEKSLEFYCKILGFELVNRIQNLRKEKGQANKPTL